MVDSRGDAEDIRFVFTLPAVRIVDTSEFASLPKVGRVFVDGISKAVEDLFASGAEVVVGCPYLELCGVGNWFRDRDERRARSIGPCLVGEALWRRDRDLFQVLRGARIGCS